VTSDVQKWEAAQGFLSPLRTTNFAMPPLPCNGSEGSDHLPNAAVCGLLPAENRTRWTRPHYVSSLLQLVNLLSIPGCLLEGKGCHLEWVGPRGDQFLA
jgi:hypothetical protein